jgi:hypothetical protein
MSINPWRKYCAIPFLARPEENHHKTICRQNPSRSTPVAAARALPPRHHRRRVHHHRFQKQDVLYTSRLFWKEEEVNHINHTLYTTVTN